MFGGDFVFKGVPSLSGCGNTFGSAYGLAISVKSEHVNGAWEFLRLVLSEGWQRRVLNDINYRTDYIPTNRIVLDERLVASMGESQHPYIFLGDIVTEARSLTQEDTDKIRALVYSVSSVPPQSDDAFIYIYMEVMSDFFSGTITAQNAAHILQDRVSIYVSEQG